MLYFIIPKPNSFCFQDVLAAFKVLIDEGSVPIQNYEKLLCLKTVFAILSGQGDNLTIDPAR